MYRGCAIPEVQGLYFFADYTSNRAWTLPPRMSGLVDSATVIARSLGVSELAIALTIVAGGTSAPELVTSVVAALRRQPEIAVGNVLGRGYAAGIGMTIGSVFGRIAGREAARHASK